MVLLFSASSSMALSAHTIQLNMEASSLAPAHAASVCSGQTETFLSS